MTEAMLQDRQSVLDDTVQLVPVLVMAINDRFGLGVSVSKAIYGKYGAVAAAQAQAGAGV